MSALLAIIAWTVAISVFVPALVLFAEVVAAQLSSKPRLATGDLPTLVIIIPAHNEGANIIPTLGDLKAGIWEGVRILVVADNCTDDTAQIAEDHGAEVVIRNEPDLRGKGYALQFAIDALRASPPQIIAFFDADSSVPEDAPARLARLAALYDRPVQTQYLMQPPPKPDAGTAIAGFAWLLINKVRMGGLSRLANVTRFTGVGMAAPWQAIEDFRFGSGAITEDHALTFALAERARAPLYDSSVVVESRFPEKSEDSVTQRARWEHGSLGVIMRLALPNLIKGIATGNAQLIAISLDGLVPPIVLFVGTILLSLIITGGALLAGIRSPFYLVLFSGSLVASALVLAWVRDGREVAPVDSLMGAVPFLWQKIKIYGRQGRNSAKTWSRTGRDQK